MNPRLLCRSGVRFGLKSESESVGKVGSQYEGVNAHRERRRDDVDAR